MMARPANGRKRHFRRRELHFAGRTAALPWQEGRAAGVVEGTGSKECRPEQERRELGTIHSRELHISVMVASIEDGT
jgi:hypothetical protein